MEPSPEAVIYNLIPKHITLVMYGALLNSKASEQIFKNVRNGLSATKNANEFIR